MTDLVERLRAVAEHGGHVTDSDAIEAAAEIERLRAEQAELAALLASRDDDVEELRAEVERLQTAYDRLTGEKFSDRVHVALRDRAQTAEAEVKARTAAQAALQFNVDVLAKEVEALRAEIKRLAAEADVMTSPAERYWWLRAESVRVDPIAAVVIKKGHDRHSSEWCNVVDLDADIDAAREGK